MSNIIIFLRLLLLFNLLLCSCHLIAYKQDNISITSTNIDNFFLVNPPGYYNMSININANGLLYDLDSLGHYQLKISLQTISTSKTLEGITPCIHAKVSQDSFMNILSSTTLMENDSNNTYNASTKLSSFVSTKVKRYYSYNASIPFSKTVYYIEFTNGDNINNFDINVLTESCTPLKTIGNWNDSNRWVKNIVPTKYDDVIIPQGAGYIVFSYNITIASLSMEGGILIGSKTTCQSGWYSDNDAMTSKCYSLNTNSSTFENSQQQCINTGNTANLMEISNYRELYMAKRLCRGVDNTSVKENGCWIGLNYNPQNGSSVWVDAKVVSYPGFRDWHRYSLTQSFNHSQSSCVYLYPWQNDPMTGEQGSFTLNLCSVTRPFLCQNLGKTVRFSIQVLKDAYFNNASLIGGNLVLGDYDICDIPGTKVIYSLKLSSGASLILLPTRLVTETNTFSLDNQTSILSRKLLSTDLIDSYESFYGINNDTFLPTSEPTSEPTSFVSEYSNVTEVPTIIPNTSSSTVVPTTSVNITEIASTDSPTSSFPSISPTSVLPSFHPSSFVPTAVPSVAKSSDPTIIRSSIPTSFSTYSPTSLPTSSWELNSASTLINEFYANILVNPLISAVPETMIQILILEGGSILDIQCNISLFVSNYSYIGEYQSTSSREFIDNELQFSAKPNDEIILNSGSLQPIIKISKSSIVSTLRFDYFIYTATKSPTTRPTSYPTCNPTVSPTSFPTTNPSCLPSAVPTPLPSSSPSSIPTVIPTVIPTHSPSCEPSARPSSFKPSSFSPTVESTVNPATLQAQINIVTLDTNSAVISMTNSTVISIDNSTVASFNLTSTQYYNDSDIQTYPQSYNDSGIQTYPQSYNDSEILFPPKVYPVQTMNDSIPVSARDSTSRDSSVDSSFYVDKLISYHHSINFTLNAYVEVQGAIEVNEFTNVIFNQVSICFHLKCSSCLYLMSLSTA